MDKNKYLTTGQVSKIMNITKNTLFHYDSIGLFSPEVKLENEYRYYSVYQLEVLKVIMTLRQLGIPLAEIREYMRQRSEAGYERLLAAEEEIIEKRMKDLKQKRQWLKEQKKLLLEIERIPMDGVEVLFRAKQYYWRSELSRTDELEISRQMGALMEKYRRSGLESGYSLVYVQSEKELSAGNINHYLELCLFMNKKPKGVRCETLPEGSYLTAYHRGHWDEIKTAYDRIRTYAAEHRLALDQKYYEDDLLDAKMTEDYGEYITRIMVRILDT